MVIIEIHAKPGAKRESVGGEHDGRLRIKVSARAEKGRANDAIAEALARALRLPKSAVTLRSGQTSRMKRFAVDGDSDAIQERLKQLLNSD